MTEDGGGVRAILQAGTRLPCIDEVIVKWKENERDASALRHRLRRDNVHRRNCRALGQRRPLLFIDVEYSAVRGEGLAA